MPKKIPQRMCVGCREMREKRQLIRVVRTADSEAVLDKTGKMSGRGAYLCPDKDCLTKAKKSRGLERALNIKISDDVFDRLAEEISYED
ncbi:MAG: YlxR family protein [Bacillota bacterium]|nr:YlxR family protein [Bacillota bacterium]